MYVFVGDAQCETRSYSVEEPVVRAATIVRWWSFVTSTEDFDDRSFQGVVSASAVLTDSVLEETSYLGEQQLRR